MRTDTSFRTEREIAEYEDGYADGSNEMLDSIRGALKEFPNVGGDVTVMQEVERIVREALEKKL